MTDVPKNDVEAALEADARLAEQGMQFVIGYAEDALNLAANRLQRLAMECTSGSIIRSDANEWAQDARLAAAEVASHRTQPTTGDSSHD